MIAGMWFALTLSMIILSASLSTIQILVENLHKIFKAPSMTFLTCVQIIT